MEKFTSLLTSFCSIREKTKAKQGYETTISWATTLEDVPTRKDSSTSASINDSKIRINTDDDIFFFSPDVVIKRGNQIVFDDENYDVIKVNKVYGASSEVHHLEVVARLVDHD